MTPELKTLLASAEGQKRELLARIEALSANDRQQAKPGAWSPQQVIEHLVTFEETMLGWMESTTGTERPGIKGHVFATLITGLMRAAIPTPTPRQFEVVTPTPLPTQQARWNSVRSRIKSRLEAHTEGPSAPFMIHPMAGPLTASQALSLLDSHLTYHLRRPPLNIASKPR